MCLLCGCDVVGVCIRYSTVTINVGNSNEAPIVANYVMTIDENTPAGSINNQVGLRVPLGTLIRCVEACRGAAWGRVGLFVVVLLLG